jgi:hypothetical protein
MTKRSLVLATAVWLLSFFSLSAQVGFSMPTVTNTVTGQQVNLPVSVINFDTVLTAQFVIWWDPQVIQFEGIEHQPNPLSLVDSVRFNQNETAQGFLYFTWEKFSGLTLADGTVIFTLNMKVIGANGTSTNVVFTEAPPTLYFEVVRNPGGQVFNINTALLTQGFVGVGTVDAPEQQATFSNLLVAPNPFSAATTATFSLTEAAPVRCWVTDVTGRICFEEIRQWPAGRNGTVIDNTLLHAHGLYFLHLSTGQEHVVRPIVFSE